MALFYIWKNEDQVECMRSLGQNADKSRVLFSNLKDLFSNRINVVGHHGLNEMFKQTEKALKKLKVEDGQMLDF